jgi:hypothetical protein
MYIIIIVCCDEKMVCKAFIVQHVTRTSEATSDTSDNRPASHQAGEGNGITPFTPKQMCGEKYSSAQACNYLQI